MANGCDEHHAEQDSRRCKFVAVAGDHGEDANDQHPRHIIQYTMGKNFFWNGVNSGGV